jgi:Ca2+-binding RTX toxin-like protein
MTPLLHSAPTEIVFIDGSLPDLDKLIDALPAGRLVHVLDPRSDGLQQMAGVLALHAGLSAVHVLSHGGPGYLTLGNAHIDNMSLADYGIALQTIGRALAPGADLLLYGCDVAAGPGGQAFLGALASATGADIAASSDLTGAAALGGNWHLEQASGPIETGTLQLPSYAFTLESPDIPGSTATTAFLPVNGAVSGLVEFGGDQDWYQVALQAGRTYLFLLSKANQSPLDPLLRLFDSGSTQLDANDDGAGDLNSRLIFTASEDGIHHAAAGGFGVRTGEYTLQLFDLTNKARTQGGDNADVLAVRGTDNQYLEGGSGNDTLSSGSGADLLNGAGGADLMLGGDGDDIYLIDNAGDVAIESWNDAAGGVDTVYATTSAYTLGFGLEHLALHGFTNGAGTGNTNANRLVGDATNNTLSGLDGDDTLQGGAGNDLLDGGNGVDRASYLPALSGVTVNLALAGAQAVGGGEGTDTLVSIEDLEGGAFDDQLWGNGSNNLVLGGMGNDTIHASLGTDRLDGGEGNDTVVLDFSGGVTIDLASDAQQSTEQGSSATLGGFENVVGGGGADYLIGDGADNKLDGAGGNDTLIGGGGNDTLLGGAGADYLEGGQGNDELDGGPDDALSLGSFGMDIASYTGSDQEIFVDLRIEGPQFTGAGLDTLIGIEAVWGSSYDDYLIGDDNENLLRGGFGDDTLDGGGGADILQGGDGNDDYYVDDSGDVVDESGGSGYDTIFTSASISLANGVERGVFTSFDGGGMVGNDQDNQLSSPKTSFASMTMIGLGGDDSIEGGAGSDFLDGGDDHDSIEGGDNLDQLFGGSGNDTLDGGSGADDMVGGTGSDWYFVDDINDAVTETGNGNSSASSSSLNLNLYPGALDTVVSSINEYVLGDFVENLVLAALAVSGVGNELRNSLLGNADNNRLEGLAGDDTLDGAAGADLLLGGRGNDWYYVDNPDDFVEEFDNVPEPGGTQSAGELSRYAGALDTVVASTLSFTLGDFIEDLVQAGVGNAVGTGNALDNTLTGNDGANTLRGLDGDDTLSGGLGEDTLEGGIGNDSLTGGAGFDTAQFAGARAAYAITRGTVGTATVTGADGIDALAGIERLVFGDATVLLDSGTADFNADLRAELVWRNAATGANALWAGAASAQSLPVAALADTQWRMVGAADIDGDRAVDILWRHAANGANMFWKSGLASNPAMLASVGDLSWKIAGLGDFNGDGSADILWRNSATGVNTIWRSGNSGQGQAVSAIGDTAWKVAGIGDFNGDGVSDILWRNGTTGANVLWRNADNVRAQGLTSVADLNWKVAGVGDFNGDGVSDILWRNMATGDNAIWKSADSAQVQNVSNVGDLAWKVAGVGDYNGDGKADILWRNGTTGSNAIWNGANSATGLSVSNIPDTNWTLQGQTGTWSQDAARVHYDFDGDGKSDLLWRNTLTGANAVWKGAVSANGLPVSNVADTSWKVAGIGDFNGDGKADILWRSSDPAVGGVGVNNTIWKGGSSSSPQTVSSIGDLNWKVAGIGDFDGDGKDDILWRNISTGGNAIWKGAVSANGMAVSGIPDLNWKAAGIGDFDGDGKDDILWRNTSTGTNTIWKGANSATPQAVSSVSTPQWQVAGVADFNGDGKDDILWRNGVTGQNAIWGGGASSSGLAISSVGDLNFQVAGTGDYNGDGKADVLWRNATAGTNIIWSGADSARVIGVTGVAGAAWSVQDETGTWVNAAGLYEI